LVLHPDDLFSLSFRFLGRIKVKDYFKKGFTKERALKDLKIEAFKRYGNLAQGITNIEYKRRPLQNTHFCPTSVSDENIVLRIFLIVLYYPN